MKYLGTILVAYIDFIYFRYNAKRNHKKTTKSLNKFSIEQYQMYHLYVQ